jgi:GTP cyclohydrolase I
VSLANVLALPDAGAVGLKELGVDGRRYPVLVWDRRVRIDVEPAESDSSLWFEELVDVVKRSASSPLYVLIKRPERRHVAISAHDNPGFVEDIARAAVVSLRTARRVTRGRVLVANDEGFHNHAAFTRSNWVAADGGTGSG